jgi:hypothetical protein
VKTVICVLRALCTIASLSNPCCHANCARVSYSRVDHANTANCDLLCVVAYVDSPCCHVARPTYNGRHDGPLCRIDSGDARTRHGVVAGFSNRFSPCIRPCNTRLLHGTRLQIHNCLLAHLGSTERTTSTSSRLMNGSAVTMCGRVWGAGAPPPTNGRHKGGPVTETVSVLQQSVIGYEVVSDVIALICRRAQSHICIFCRAPLNLGAQGTFWCIPAWRPAVCVGSACAMCPRLRCRDLLCPVTPDPFGAAGI